MAKLLLANGGTGVILRIKITDSSKSDGSGVTGLDHTTTDLVLSTQADNESTDTFYSSAAGTIETVSVLGTYAAPTAGKCRFKEINATRRPGWYEVHLANARYAVTNATQLGLVIPAITASNVAQLDAEIQLFSYMWTDSWSRIMETQGNYTAQQILSILLSNAAGVTQDGDFYTPDGVSKRIDPTLDSNNNRTNMTLTPSS